MYMLYIYISGYPDMYIHIYRYRYRSIYLYLYRFNPNISSITRPLLARGPESPRGTSGAPLRYRIARPRAAHPAAPPGP